jgi:hypothetical protein
MLKHHCSALLILHAAETPLFSTLLTRHPSPTETTPSSNCFAPFLKHQTSSFFSPDAETPLSSNSHVSFFPMLKHHCQHCSFFPMLKHHCSALFILPTPKTLQSTISSPFHRRNNSVQQLFRLFPSVAETPLQQLFIFFPMLKHHCSALSSFFPDAETPLFSTFDFLPMLKHHCSALLTFFRC